MRSKLRADLEDALGRRSLVELVAAIALGTGLWFGVRSLVDTLLTAVADLGGDGSGILPGSRPFSFQLDGHLFDFTGPLEHLVTFAIVALIVLAALRRLRRAEEPDAELRACPYCCSPIATAASVCAWCSSDVEPAAAGSDARPGG